LIIKTQANGDIHCDIFASAWAIAKLKGQTPLPRILSELTVLSYMKAYASITQ
jgi:hypothetical protein